jgi:hypothetical protein
MVRLDATARREAGVTLVAAVVESDVGSRVTLIDRCGGPVRPPRRQGVPVLDWAGGRTEVVLGAGEARAVGYATPAPPADPPVAVASAAPVVPTPTLPDGAATEEGADPP